MKKLSQTDVRKLPDGSHNFGDGLMLRVSGNSRSWFLRMQVDGKRLQRGLGSALIVTLGQARLECAKLKAELKSGDTRTKKQKADDERNGLLAQAPAFEDIWEQAIDARAKVAMWRNEKHANQWKTTIRTYALPVLGKLDVSVITRQDVLRVLLPIWETKTETAYRVRGRLETIFDWCIREGLREKENPARWKGMLEFDLPQRTKVAPVKHFNAPTVEELQTAAVDLCFSVSEKCTLFGILTACRTKEFVNARWDEIDWKDKVWNVPPDRRKDGKQTPHRVPLSEQAIKLLKTFQQRDDFIFCGMQGNRVINLQTPRVVLMRLLGRAVTMHGCRSTFRDWCAEHGVDHTVAEKCLMHAVGSEVVQAYQRSDLLEQRRPVMQAWADAICAKCEALRSSSTPSS